MITIILGTVNARFCLAVEKEDKFREERIKTFVLEMGIGEAARVSVELTDGRKFKGYITAASEETFVVVPFQSEQAIQVSYSQIADIKKIRSTKTFKIVFGLAAAVMVAGFLLYAGD
jgi:hypothetical protein